MSRARTRPRSGLGLNELLDRCQPWLLTDHLTPPESSAEIRFSRTSRTQKRSAGVLAGTEFVAKTKGLDRRGPTTPSQAPRLLAGIFFWTGLTPELSRADLRPWASENEPNSHEAAKRARLERIVRPVPAVASDQSTDSI